jgi:hypothetical protein
VGLVAMSKREKETDVDDHVEAASFNEKKDVATLEKGDYSGAVAKSDPAEIALVRKLDIRIMV